MICSVVLDRAHCCNVRTGFGQCLIRAGPARPKILPCHVVRLPVSAFLYQTLKTIACYKFMTLACPNEGVDSKSDGINRFKTVADVIDHFLGEPAPSAVPIKPSF